MHWAKYWHAILWNHEALWNPVEPCRTLRILKPLWSTLWSLREAPMVHDGPKWSDISLSYLISLPFFCQEGTKRHLRMHLLARIAWRNRPTHLHATHDIAGENNISHYPHEIHPKVIWLMTGDCAFEMAMNVHQEGCCHHANHIIWLLGSRDERRCRMTPFASWQTLGRLLADPLQTLSSVHWPPDQCQKTSGNLTHSLSPITAA